jgi:transposase
MSITTNCGWEIRPRSVQRWYESKKPTRAMPLHILDLLLTNRFPRIPSPAERDVRQMLRHRHKLVGFRTPARNQFHALAMGQGLCRKQKLWTIAGRKELEALNLDPWAS